MLPCEVSIDSLYDEAAYYRMLFRERTHDAAFYLRTIPCEASVLELGVGDGRMAVALARERRRVVGVDNSLPMLHALEERLANEPADVRSRIETAHGDSRYIRLDERFAWAACPFNGLAHFHTSDAQAELLTTVRHHLMAGGRFAFDVMLPDPKLLSGGGSSVSRLVHPRTGRICRLEETYTYDAMRQVLTVETHLIDRETGDRQTLTLSLLSLIHI